MIRVAALFVQKGGAYYGIDGVIPWSIDDDARNYAGPHPVVAHPPCQLWTNFAALNFKRYGGEHNRPGNDGGCFGAAVHAVCEYGGVLEHPAYSRAWPHFGLPRPATGRWLRALHGRGWVTEVCQSAYGHRARKRTWLYYVGEREPMPMDWRDVPATHQIGWFDRIKPTLGKKEASATPPAFKTMLISLARSAT